ncbi:MAG: VWA domain-containing protein [Verrucomicrobiota bacterium]
MKDSLFSKENHWTAQRIHHKKQSGQYTALFAILLLPILLFSGMGLDFGLYYIDEARLVRAVDGAALRLGSNFTDDVNLQQKIVSNLMEANYPGWGVSGPWEALSGDPDDYEYKSVSSNGATVYYVAEQAAVKIGSGNLFPRPETRGYDGEDNVGDARGGYTYTSTLGLREAIYEGYEWDNLDYKKYRKVRALSVRIKAEVKHRTFFLPLAGINYMNLKQETEVGRRPSIIMLVLDASSSMKAEDTGDGPRYEALIRSVKNFVQEFDNEQDYFGVVYFSSIGRVVFPNNGPFVPRANFKDVISDMMDTTDDVSQDYLLGERTNAQEGMRVAYNVVENFFSALPGARDNVNVSYVFFTDGDFNTTRSLARGPGYNTVHSQNSVPWTHNIKPLSSNGNLSGVRFDRLDSSGNDVGSYDLASLIQGVDITTLEGVNANIGQWTNNFNNNNSLAWRSQASSQSYSDEDADSAGYTDAVVTAIMEGNNLNSQHDDFWAPWSWLEEDAGVSPGSFNLINRSPVPIVMSAINDKSDESKYGYVIDDGVDKRLKEYLINPDGSETSTPKEHYIVGPQLMRSLVANEVSRLGERSILLFPGRIRSPRQNWTSDSNTVLANMVLHDNMPDEWKALEATPNQYPYYYYRTPLVDASIRWGSAMIEPTRDMEHQKLEFIPGSEVFNNHYIRYHQRPPVDDARFGTWDNGDREIDNIDEDSWFIATNRNRLRERARTSRSFRMEEIYPEFYFGENLASSVSGDPTEFYRWDTGAWERFSYDNIVSMAEWLIEAQCWLARRDHDATIYTVVFGNDLKNEHYSMSNMNASEPGKKLWDEQKLGVCYKAQTSTELQEVFADIASRIAVSITQ